MGLSLQDLFHCKGNFSSVDGQPRGRLARATFSSTLDNFHNGVAGSNGTVRTVIHDGGAPAELLIDGSFASYNGVTVQRIVGASAQNDGAISTCYAVCGVTGR